MAGQWKSVLGGAFVAALLILPAAAGDTGWINGPWRGFDAKDLRVDGMVGKLRVDVKPQSQISVQISGRKSRVDNLSVHTSGSTVVISSDNQDGVWHALHSAPKKTARNSNSNSSAGYSYSY